MNSRRWLVALMAALIAACSQPATKSAPSSDLPDSATAEPGKADTGADRTGPERIAIGFYTAYLKLPAGGVPSADGRARLRPYISPALEQLLINAAAAEVRHDAATNGQEPPLLEGDPFTSLFEGATEFGEPDCTEGSGSKASCKVALTHADPEGGTAKWTDTLDLVELEAVWRINDIEYGGVGDFGHHGRLTELLKAVIADAPS